MRVKCKYCRRTFSSEEKLAEHYRRDHHLNNAEAHARARFILARYRSRKVKENE